MEKVKIEHQGAPIVNTDNVHTVAQSKDIILLEIDMRSKYCEVMMHIHDECPSVLICKGEHSLHLNDDEEGTTELELCGYKEWNIFLAEILRYTLRVCLVKRGN